MEIEIYGIKHIFKEINNKFKCVDLNFEQENLLLEQGRERDFEEK